MIKHVLVLMSFLALVACSSDDHEDLRQWMLESAKDMRGNIAKLPEVLPYEPVPYNVETKIDPFRASKIEPDAKNRQNGGKGGAFEPDFEARELRNSLLEKYPLETLKLIGLMNINRQSIAVIQVEDKVKQVKLGDYIGLDFGMVTKITDKEVELRELIQDSAGDWSERKSSLYLQSKEGSKK